MDTKNIKKNCPVMDLFQQLSKMRVLPILLMLNNGNKYFSTIKNSLDGISSRTLSIRLKELQEDGFIIREIISEQPIKIEYRLSEKGIFFGIELEKLAKSAIKWENI